MALPSPFCAHLCLCRPLPPPPPPHTQPLPTPITTCPAGVATGIFTREQLEAVAPGNPDLVVVDSFEDLEATLKAIGLGSA